MYNFTVLERMILESVNKSAKDLEQIHEDTGLDKSICTNVLFSLLAKNLIIIDFNVYRLNKNLSEAILSELTDQRNRCVEINALVRECVKLSLLEGSDTFKFKKVYMSEKDKKLLKAMLYNIETFLDGLKSQKGKTKEETFVFWGGENYANAINAYIS